MGCKLLGLQWVDCNPFLLAFQFDNCQLDFSNFAACPLKGTQFNNSSLREVDFSGSDLRKCQFDNCDLNRALFDRSQLQEADFRTAFGYQIDPEANQMNGARFAVSGVAGLLIKYGIEIDGLV